MAKKIIYLINQNDIPRLTSISGNIDIDTLRVYVKIAQDCNIKPLLGDKLYNKIENDFINDTLSGDYLRLYDDYIVDLISYYTAYHLFTLHNYKVANNGIMVASPEYNETLDVTEIEKISQRYLKLAGAIEQQYIDNVNKYDIIELNKNCGGESRSFGLNWQL